ncbi:uncharacterized protein LOC111086764 isoform X2 [Limulus polyphemus]|nr:uncharacterized protein LOC111086764 isoform X2 [Limulus polyphemus]XP_022246665.1 uncharacterized protein LOC111086764 isoform X2 [Limulus polyphemus]
MDEQETLPSDEYPPVFEEECSSVASQDRPVRSRLQESMDSGYEASPASNSCQEIFNFTMDDSTEAYLPDNRPCQAVVGDQWSDIGNHGDSISHELGLCGQDSQTCVCGYGKDQTNFSLFSCSSHVISRENTEDQESPNSLSHSVPIVVRRNTSGSDPTRDILWSSEIVIRPGSYPRDRLQLLPDFGPPVSSPRLLQSENHQTHFVHNRYDWTVGEGPNPQSGNQTISVATQTNFEILPYDDHLFGSAGTSNDDPVSPNQDSHSSLLPHSTSSNRPLPDVVQTPSSRFAVRHRTHSVNLPLNQWIQETGLVLREISTDFEQNLHQEVSERGGMIRYWLNRIVSWLLSNQGSHAVRRRRRYYSTGDEFHLGM